MGRPELAESGDAAAAGIFDLAGRRLGQAIANIVNLLDPDRIIVGGGVAQAGDLILKPCRETVPPLVLAAEAKDVPVVTAELGPLAAAVGYLLGTPPSPLPGGFVGFVSVPAAACLVVTAIPGAQLGAWLNKRVGTTVYRRVFGLLLLFVVARLVTTA